MIGSITADGMRLLSVFAGQGEFRLSEVSDACGMPPEAAVQAIDELLDAGMLTAQGTRFTLRFGSRAAVHGLARLNEQGEGSQLDSGLINARAALDGVLGGDHGVAGGVVKITDRTALIEQLDRLARHTRSNLISLHSGPAPSDQTLDSSVRADTDMLDRGVKLRIVFPVGVLAEQRMRDYTERMEAIGTEIRFADALPHRLIVSDAAWAIVPVDRADLSLGALLASEPLLVASLRHLAGTLFRRGRRLSEVDLGALDTAPTTVELRMIAMMSSGVTDEVAARRLAVSERTFRRHMSALLDRLGATSRFQAGIRAVERGWI